MSAPGLAYNLASIPRRLAVRRNARACLGRDRPVIVYTPPKSGSTSVEAGLAAADVPALKVHFLSSNLEAVEQRWRARGVLLDRHIYAARHVRAALSDGVRPRFVTMVRDPIARLASASFQSRRAKGLDGADAGTHLDRLRRRIGETADDPLAWFTAEIEPDAGIDFEAEGFDAARGWQVYDGRLADVMLIKTSRLEDCAGPLSDFVGAPVAIGRENARADGRAAETYREVGARLRMPKEDVRRLTDDRLMRLFFTDEERAAMVSRWSE